AGPRQPRSAHRVPGSRPASWNNSRVLARRAAASTRRRSYPSRPPRITYRSTGTIVEGRPRELRRLAAPALAAMEEFAHEPRGGIPHRRPDSPVPGLLGRGDGPRVVDDVQAVAVPAGPVRTAAHEPGVRIGPHVHQPAALEQHRQRAAERRVVAA